MRFGVQRLTINHITKKTERHNLMLFNVIRGHVNQHAFSSIL